MSVMADLLGTLFERRYRAGAPDPRALPELSRALVEARAEGPGGELARALLDRYAAAERDERLAWFTFLAEEMDLDTAALTDALATYAEDSDPEAYRRLAALSEPPRQELARRLNQVPGATAQLVAMRADLLSMIPDAPGLQRVDLDFRHLFKSWFNRGFLVLRPITWESPAHILEKIIAYEAVHEIHSWDDLRRRLEPADRRCFAFFHPSMPDEPLIFVEVALTTAVPGSIQALLSEDRAQIDPGQATTATFYSISNCQDGLAGISFGNFLIKQVVRDLQRDLPQITRFVTLSPIPGLCAWTAETGLDWPDDGAAQAALAAHYLLKAKGRGTAPRDPVARFHLGNGALVHAVHSGADTSDNGRRQSGGVMVNYLYDLDRIAENHARFHDDGTIAASRDMVSLAKRAPMPRLEQTETT
ncbi:malonyl-CoA decarboxylase [Dinoroseobacter shibae DFL 12 = DSM 16493]|uniref:Malonyl-CoA decarboxylase n=1 Tax=Dinoroseobacter shibae (strain DSM 16493 / NCIMB 14021 / DFL 12) TaxID=398580 RepID=A8LKF0_DINSH|nr:malonyl-CoA decarboxylase family protein [Dinoroseobacter shibae]ABV94733.1 malonyl-CoA decarboxylase [Dinoroseobacter shibae DFL 12 = DSM 16493]URF46154.1 malonyl-CoA decarboxylase [Dinoroseobacter shibae]URF50461.1 malonyl-CoA decarboxylase [Dinoroseobacter shibae]